MVKFLPSYVGSKSYWVPHLAPILQRKRISELFAGSAIISANLASTAYLNDIDPQIFKILSNYDDLLEIESFSKDDYFRYRASSDWWRAIYYLQKMSFSGVFRYSKNGYNVPIKPDKITIEILPDLLLAKARMRELNPRITNLSYLDVDIGLIEGSAIIFDPPYEGSQASYNKKNFNYDAYWDFVERIKPIADPLIIFDRQENLQGSYSKSRKMRVNGGKPGGIEVMHIFERKPTYASF